MIALAMMLATVPVGPGLRLAPPNADGTPVVLALDRNGRVATRITCPANAWADPHDSAAALIASTTVMATVVSTDGRLTSSDQLGPARFACVLAPPETKGGGA